MPNPDIDHIVSNIEKHITDALDNFIPLRKFRQRMHKFPWLTVDFESKLKQKNRLFKRAERSGLLVHYEIYRRYRNNLSSELKNAKSKFSMTKLNEITEPAAIWREFSSLGLTKSQSLSPFNSLTPQLIDYYATIINNASSCDLEDLASATKRV